jgi:hypothetical protein
VDQCWQQKVNRIRLNEQGEASQAYQAAKAEYQKRLAEIP